MDDLEINWIKINNSGFRPLVEKILNRTIFRGSLGVNIERSILKASQNSDLIYSVCGPPAVAKYMNKKVISWAFRPPEKPSSSILDSYSKINSSSHKAFFCLTPNAEKYYSKYAKSNFIPWCVDLDLFDGKQYTHKQGSPFFLATGKTGRDYATLMNAAHLVDAEIRIIGPKIQKPDKIPSNVNWIETSEDPPDNAIDYLTLRNWYSQAIGVCIPLSGDADDTCGYTNLLEAMAMRKPVIMTQSGCLHINPESDGFGIQIKPRDAQGWSQAMNHLRRDHEQALKMGIRGREIVERDFTIERFNKDVVEFMETTIAKV